MLELNGLAMKVVLLGIPPIPSDNNLYQNNRGGGRRLGDRGRNLKATLVLLFLEQMGKNRKAVTDYLNGNERVNFNMVLGVPQSVLVTKAGKPKRWDAVNHHKLAEDAFTVACTRFRPDWDDNRHRPFSIGAMVTGDDRHHLAVTLTDPGPQDPIWSDWFPGG